jgi:XapX domain-containing protein
MRVYLLSFGVGLLVGVIYSLLNVRSPAPPVVALIGLLGILVGEQVVPLAKRFLAGDNLSLSAVREDCAEHVFGALPTRGSAPKKDMRA